MPASLITATPADSPTGSFSVIPLGDPLGSVGRELLFPMGLGSVSMSWYWNIPPGGTREFATASETPVNPGVGAAATSSDSWAVAAAVEDQKMPKASTNVPAQAGTRL